MSTTISHVFVHEDDEITFTVDKGDIVLRFGLCNSVMFTSTRRWDVDKVVEVLGRLHDELAATRVDV